MGFGEEKMATLVKCGYTDCDWSYKTKEGGDTLEITLKEVVIHYFNEHDVPRPMWEFYVQ